jgi:glycerol-3-phosphate acyltransferase PlsY
MTSDIERRLAISLLLLRLSLGLVMMVWAFDKILNPGHGAAVFEGFYGLSGVGESVIPMIGIAQGLIVLAFLPGFAKTWSYGAVLLMHAVTTLVSFSAYLEPLKNILFFAAWPMLAGLIALFLLRDHDRIASIGGGKSRAAKAAS